MSRVLVIGDTHFPAVLDGYLQFVKDIKAEYKCDTILHIGDIVDHHCTETILELSHTIRAHLGIPIVYEID